MTSSKATVYVGRWNETDYVYSLSFDEAVASVKKHFAYGDPAKDHYAVGEKWASESSDSGWRIVQREMCAPSIDVDIKAGNPEETGHVVWICPFCRKTYSDEWQSDDKLPVLLMCECNEKSKFLLGVQHGQRAHSG